MTSTGPRPRLRALLAAAGLSAGIILAPTAAGIAEAVDPPPTISVIARSGTVQFHDWPSEHLIDVTIGGTTVEGSPFTSDQCASGCDRLPVAAGLEVVASNLGHGGSDEARVTVVGLTTSTVRVEANTVAGTVDPGSVVEVHVTDPGIMVEVTDTGSGEWVADFSSNGGLGEGAQGWASVTDHEGDATWAWWETPRLAVQVEADQIIGQGGWTDGAEITVDIDDPDDLLDRVLYATGGARQIAEDSWDAADGNPIEPGDVITATDGLVTRIHTVREIAITDVDVESDTVTGTTTFEANDYIDAHFDQCSRRGLGVDPDGFFTADFGAPGAQPGEEESCDVVPGSWGEASQFDDDNDYTIVWWNVPHPPAFHVEAPHRVMGEGDGWPVGAVIDLGIWSTDDPATQLYPPTGTVTTTVGYLPDYDIDGFEFDLTGEFEIQPGHEVRIAVEHDGTNPGPELTKELVVDDLVVDVDEANVVLSGTSDYADGAPVHVNTPAAIRDTSVQGRAWSVDFATEPEPELGFGYLTNFGGAMEMEVKTLDDDGDFTRVGLRSPSIHVSPYDDFMWGNDFAPGDPVSVTVDDVEIETPTPDEWGYFELDMPFAPDTTMAARQHGWIADVDIADLQITAINEPSQGIVSGRAPTGSLVDVHAWSDQGWASRVADVTDGTFTVDFSSEGDERSWERAPLGLTAGSQLRAHIYDDRDLPDHDATYHDACVGECGGGGGPRPEPEIHAHVTVDHVGGNHFTPDSTVSVMLYEFEGGPVVFDENLDTNGEGNFGTDVWIDEGVQPRMVVEVVDDALGVTKRLTVADVRFDSFAPDDNTVAGYVLDPPMEPVFLQLFDWDGVELLEPGAGNIPVDRVGTSWSADLDDYGHDPDALAHASVWVPDHDGFTIADLPQVLVTVPHTVESNDFDSDWSVTVELLDGSDSVTVEDVPVSARGRFTVPTEEYGVDLDPGDEVTVTGDDTGIVKHHVVRALDLGEVDYAADTVSGTAAGDDYVIVGSAVGEVVVQAGGDGTWIAHFDDDLAEGTLVRARVGDPDLDFTVVEQAPPPYILAEPFREIVWAEYFPTGNQLELLVTDGAGRTLLGPRDATVEGDRVEWLLLPEGFDLEPGHVVTVTDLGAPPEEPFVRELVVADIGVTIVDDVADVVEGTVDAPGSPGVYVAVDTGGSGAERWIANDGSGLWTADFSGEVVLDKTQPLGLFIAVPDSEDDPADATVFQMPQASPGLAVEPHLDVITFEGSGLGDLTIRIPELGFEYTAVPDHPGNIGELFPGFEFDTYALAGSEVYTYGIGVDLSDEIDVVPGMVVEASDVLWEMSMTVTEFSVDAVDSDADTVAGYNPLPDVPEGPGLVATFVSGPVAFGFAFPDTTSWEMVLTEIGPDGPAGPYDITGTEVGFSMGTPTEDQPFDTYTVELWDLAPRITSLALPAEPVEVGQQVRLDALFTDLDVADAHTATVDWGDGDTAPGVVDGHTVLAEHIFVVPGVYTIVLTVTDRFGQTDVLEHRYLVVYDPSAGFVTGGGWIESPVGAYTPDPTLTGPANFGFVAKFKKGRVTPDGNTNFQFQTADLHFQSTEYDWLVVNGDRRAKFKGVGTVNGVEGYGFMLTATDDPDGDTFRIKIWEIDTDRTVYDNMLGAGDDSYDGTVLAGGSIVVHTAKK